MDARDEERRTRLREGPFPGRVDPWVETGRYYHQVHAGMIGHLQEQMQDDLEARGYIAAREASLQIAERREPDLNIRYRADAAPVPVFSWDYTLAATQVLAEPGIAPVGALPDLDALVIKRDGALVTVIEIISPSNKHHEGDIFYYQQGRRGLLDAGVNVVEIDLTRSVKRVLPSNVSLTAPYSLAVYLPWEAGPRLIEVGLHEPLKRLAIPLRADVIAVEPEAAYRHAYNVGRLAAQMLDEGHYSADRLPFPSLLNETQKAEALARVERWKAAL